MDAAGGWCGAPRGTPPAAWCTRCVLLASTPVISACVCTDCMLAGWASRPGSPPPEAGRAPDGGAGPPTGPCKVRAASFPSCA
ncbi:MAG: hypothetical protein J3K34DRAFT_445189, partial [Monoraphidium minutum]